MKIVVLVWQRTRNNRHISKAIIMAHPTVDITIIIIIPSVIHRIRIIYRILVAFISNTIIIMTRTHWWAFFYCFMTQFSVYLVINKLSWVNILLKGNRRFWMNQNFSFYSSLVRRNVIAWNILATNIPYRYRSQCDHNNSDQQKSFTSSTAHRIDVKQRKSKTTETCWKSHLQQISFINDTSKHFKFRLELSFLHQQ